MGKVKRDRLAVIFDILNIIRERHNSIKPTPLLRFSNLSSTSFVDYYHDLQEKGLIKEMLDEKERKYVTLTDKGFAFLDKYEYIKGFIKEFEL